MVDPLRSYDEFSRSVRNFAWLKGAAPGASDVDLLIERHGKFLVLEAKPFEDGVVMPYGQHLALTALAEVPGFTVYLVGEDSEENARLANYGTQRPKVTFKRPSDGRTMVVWKPRQFRKLTRDELRGLVSAWWASQ